MSHPNVEDLDKMVLLLSNQQGSDRLYLEAPQGSPKSGIPAAVGLEKQDVGWFDQGWYAEMSAQSLNGASTAYTLRNIRSGTFLQAGEKLPDGSTELILAHRPISQRVLNQQTWEISNDGGFARITNLGTKQAFELIVPDDGGPARACLRDNELTNKEAQTWRYKRVSRSAKDVEDAMKANGHLRCKLIEYQSMDATYLTLPPDVRDEIWESTGLNKDPLKWRNQIFDCDDFAFTAKAAVAGWAAKNLRADGFTILFGITFGERGTDDDNKPQRHAYNWYLDFNDLTKIKFFEPAAGTESDDGWHYKGFNGLF